MENREKFIKDVVGLIQEYIENFDRFDSNPQIRVNPLTLQVSLENGSDFLQDIADNDEAIEDAAIAEKPETEDAADYQVKLNPQFYPVKSFLKAVGEKSEIDFPKVEQLANEFFN